jgi:hypothetical protein
MGNNSATRDSGRAMVASRIAGHPISPPVSLVYAASTTDGVYEAATHLASGRFISYGAWKWAELHMNTGEPVYRYLYARPRPAYLGVPCPRD